jgi:L-lactate dehydrogenase complex protein LldG
MNNILTNIRGALGVRGDEPERLYAVKARLQNHPRNLIPEDAILPHDELVAAFILRLEEVEASVAHVDGLEDVANEIARYMIIKDLPQRIRFGADPLLHEVAWGEQPDIQLLHGPAIEQDAMSLTHALAGVAETGTLFVPSGPDNPVTLSFLPETNIVLVRLEDIVGCYEDAWQKLFERGETGMPRTLNMISGPSRTADIEQTLITGAHGPRRLHVIVMG